MKRAYLVFGPESSGTRLMTRILILAGCQGSWGHYQHYDHHFPKDSPIVWRRSVPHARQWPDIVDMVTSLRNAGYSVKAVVTTRHWWPMICSQVKAGYVPCLDTARKNVRRAYRHIFSSLEQANVEYVIVSYEALVEERGPAIKAILNELQLPSSADIEVVTERILKEINLINANQKHYR
jgi:LPS sulfotransferase NodH